MKTVGYIDLLGFSNIVKVSVQDARFVLDRFYNIADRLSNNYSDLEVILFSDSLIVQSEREDTVVNYLCACFRECFKGNININSNNNQYLLCRGGITQGEFFRETRSASSNVTKHFFISPAVVHDTEIEKGIKGSRLLIGCNKENAQAFIWNRGIKAITYEKNELSIWKDFQYYDVLWPADLTKTHDEQESEIRQIINIAKDLLEHANTKNRDHYIETFRIAVLSYTKFVEIAPGRREFVFDLLDHFSGKPEYWLIWLSLVEMICNAVENWDFIPRKEFIGFYKNISLTKEWGNVLKELEKPSNNWLREKIHSEIFESIFANGILE